MLSSITQKKKQGQLFFKDPEKARAHQHYSKLTTPIVDLGVPFTSVDDEPNLNDPQHHQNSASKFVSLADARQDILIVSDSVLCLGEKKDESWMNIPSVCLDIQGGRTFLRHKWSKQVAGGRRFRRIIVVCASNDCVKGHKAKTELNPSGLAKMHTELSALSDACNEQMVFILFGDYALWNREGGRLHNACEKDFTHCQEQQLRTAREVKGVDVRHWIDPTLQSLPFCDGEHFDAGAAPHLLKLLLDLLHEASFKTAQAAPKQKDAVFPYTRPNYSQAKANRSRCALQGNAPFPWIEAWCTQYGCAYYFNTKTGEAAWILESSRGTLTPTGIHLRDSEGRWPTKEPTKEAKHAAFERTSAADDSNASFSSDSAEKPVSCAANTCRRARALRSKLGQLLDLAHCERYSALESVLWCGNFAMEQDVPVPTQSIDATQALEDLLCTALEIRERYHGMLFAQKKIADADFTRSLSDHELADLRQVWIDHAHTPDMSSVCEQDLQAYKEFEFKLFFEGKRTIETFFMQLVAHPLHDSFLYDNDDRLTLLLQSLSHLACKYAEGHREPCPKQRRTDG